MGFRLLTSLAPLSLLTLFSLGACAAPSFAQSENQRKYEGVWIYEFEASTFVEGETSAPAKRPKLDQTSILLYNPEEVSRGPDYDDYDEQRRCYPLYAFLVSFIGREETIPLGPVPGVDFWKSEITVDRMISAKPIAGPRCYDR